MLINFTTPANLMAIKRHRLPKVKATVPETHLKEDGTEYKTGKMIETMLEQETQAQYAAIPEINVAAYFDFKDIPLADFVNGIAMRGLRLAAQAEWRAEHEGDELAQWLKAQPKETHEGVEYHIVNVDVQSLMAERRVARKPKAITPDSVMADISRLAPEAALKALSALKESNPMFAAMLKQAFGEK